MPSTVVIFATSYFPHVGGAQFAIREITRRMPDTVFHLYCARLTRGITFREQQLNVCIHRIGIGARIDRFLLPLIAPFCALRYRKDAKTIWAMMAQYGGFAALLFRLLTGRSKRFVLTLQEGGDFAEMEKKAGLLLPLMRAVARNADTLQAISTSLLEWGQALGYRKSDFHVIPNGVDISLFAAQPPRDALDCLRTKHGITSDTKVLFTASRLAYKNGILDLVDAMALLPENYILLVAGEGYLQEKITSKIAELKLDQRVTMLGSLPIDQVAIYLHISHVFVRPSLSEGLGNAFLEAMAAGVPVVGTMVGGIRDFLIDGETGIVAEPGNPLSIAEAISQYEDLQLYQNIKTNGQRLVLERFDWDGIAASMTPLFGGGKSKVQQFPEISN